MKKHLRNILVVLMTLSLVMLAGCGGGNNEPVEAPDTSQQETVKADPIGVHHAKIKIKDYGTVTFYDGLTFHRIIDGFMIQGGDPNGDGTGGSGKNIPGEFESNGYTNNIAHTKGVISMARAQDPNSASSQFFIMVADAPHLDGMYAAFGHVIDGQNVVDKIASDATPLDDNGTVASEDQPVIESVEIID